MRFLARLALAAGLMLTLGAFAGQAQSISDAQRGEIEKIIREYLVQHPEVLQDAMAELEKKQAADEAVKNQAAVKDNAETIFNSAAAGRGRQPAGRRHLRRVLRLQLRLLQARHGRHVRLMKSDPKLKVVLKEFPVLGPGSVEAARVAVAVRMQDKTGEEVHRLPPEAARRPRPGRQGARARRRQGGRDGHGAAGTRPGERRGQG